MTPAARYAAAIDVLEAFLAGEPVEKTLSNWTRRNRYAGSGDRAAVRDITFDCLRNLRSFQWAAGLSGARAVAVGHCLAQGIDPEGIFSGEGHAPARLNDAQKAALTAAGTAPPEAVKSDLPDWLMEPFKQALGAQFSEIVTALKTRAPVDLRVNLGKADRAFAQRALAREDIATVPVSAASTALRVTSNPRRVAGSRAYRDGLVELQDAASQAVVDALPLARTNTILDYCAGGGGKTLAIAALAPHARISAWDHNPARLRPLRERAKRAGADVRLLNYEPHMKNGLYDLVLIDVPCSGSGAWRRNPEAKWRLTPYSLDALCKLQQGILRKSSALVAPDGALAYVTCSLLRRENEAQISAFLERNPDWVPHVERRFNLSDGGDGFYLAVLRRTIEQP